jgi:hypothetical protein
MARTVGLNNDRDDANGGSRRNDKKAGRSGSRSRSRIRERPSNKRPAMTSRSSASQSGKRSRTDAAPQLASERNSGSAIPHHEPTEDTADADSFDDDDRIEDDDEEAETECAALTDEEKLAEIAFCCSTCTCSEARKSKIRDINYDDLVQSSRGGLFHRRCCHKVTVVPVMRNWRSKFEKADLLLTQKANEEHKRFDPEIFVEKPMIADQVLWKSIATATEQESAALKKEYQQIMCTYRAQSCID